MLSRHTGIHTGFIFVCAVPLTYPRPVCCGAACVRVLFVWVWLNIPTEKFIIFIRQKKQKLQAHQSSCLIGLSSSPSASFCLLSFPASRLFCLTRSPRARHGWDDGRSFVSMLELSCPSLILSGSFQTLWAPHHLPDIWASEVCVFLCVCFLFSLWAFAPLHGATGPVPTTPIFYCHPQKVSPWGKFNTPPERKLDRSVLNYNLRQQASKQ